MSRLFVRHRNGLYLNFINDKQQLLSFEESLLPGRTFVIGDLSTFTSTMKLMLLKLIEEHPNDIDCYSSSDITDPILLSRFTQVIKDPLYLVQGSSEDEWATAKHDYMNAEQLMGTCTTDVKLRLPQLPNSLIKLIKSV